MTCEVIDGGVIVAPELVNRVSKLDSKLILQIRGDGEQSQGRDETLVCGGVQRFQSHVLHLADRDIESISDGLGQIVENLLATVIG